VARVAGTLSLSGMARPLRSELALLGTESGSRIGLFALDLAGLEDAGAGCLVGVTSSGSGTSKLIVNQSRFLMLPWVRVKGLASKILAHSARQMPQDWQTRHGLRPLLLETLVDAMRFRGTCYRAANWIHLGQTSGRGRMDREHKAHGEAVKDIYVYPLVDDVRQRLCRYPCGK